MRKLIYLASLLLVSCTNKVALKSGDPKSLIPEAATGTQDQKEPGGVTQIPPAENPSNIKTEDSEGVSVPANISGAYLYCSLDLNPNQGDPITAANCFLQDTQGNRVAPATIADSTTYSALVAPGVQWATAALPQPEFDVTFVFTATSREASRVAALGSTLILDFVGLKNGQGNTRLATPLPVTTTSRSPWAKSCNARVCSDLQTSSGLLWSKDQAVAMTWYEARNRCSSLNPSNPTFWRLPTDSDTSAMIDRPSFGLQLNIVDDTDYWLADFDSATNEALTINYGVASNTVFLVNSFNITEKKRVVCIH